MATRSKIRTGTREAFARWVLLAGTSLLGAGCAQETLFVVDTTADLQDDDPGDGACATANGSCSLRAAVQEVSAAAPGANFRVQLANPGTYAVEPSLGPGDGITVHAQGKRLYVVGCCSNPGSSVVEPTGPTRLFTVLGGAVVFDQLTLRGGRGPDPGAPGLRHGGALHVAGAGTRVLVIDSVLEDNMAGAQGRGGAIYVADDPGTQIHLSRSIVRNNSASIGGVGGAGGVHSHGATFAANTLFENNEGNGGALRIEPNAPGIVHEVLRSTFYLNRSPNQGGGAGIRADLGDSELFVSLSTFARNHTEGASGGAAIHVSTGELRLSSSTLTDNESSGGSGHALLVGSGADAILHNTVIDANPSPFTSDTEVACGVAANLVLDGYNYIDGMAAGCSYVDAVAGDNDTVGTNNSLDADLDFYQSTPIGHHAPNPGSPLIDNGPLTCSGTDQLGNPRGVGARCDTGSIEIQ